MLSDKDLKRYTFTTGAFISPVEINGKFFWVVTSFEDDTYCDGKLINPKLSGDSILDLVTLEEIEENLKPVLDEDYNQKIYTGHKYRCDECKEPLSEFSYQRNQGLCYNCVRKIN